jgi:outer membrane protein assembly factor BamA
LRVGRALQLDGGVRSLLVCLGLAAVSAIVGMRHRPQPADAARVSTPLEIQSISLDGRSLPSLRDALSLHAGDRYDAAKAARDRGSLETALVERGYLGAKVTGPDVTYDATAGAFMTYAIEQGPLFHVRSVIVTGATETNAGVVTLGVGEVVAADRIEHARLALAERLAVRGAPVHVVAKVVPDKSAAVADVEFAATP